MRILPLVLVAFLSSGCVEGILPKTHTTLFGISPIERGNPEPLPAANCEDLLRLLNQRALTQARVELDRSLSQPYGPMVAVDFESSAPVASNGAADGAPMKDAQVTGTNNQERGADEADIVKTDGEWTYVLNGAILFILRSERVGDLRLVARLDFTPASGGELLLERRNPDDPADDRLVLILFTYAQYATANVDMWVPGQAGELKSRVLLLSLADRSAPRTESDTWIEGQSVGARLVDGVAHIVIHLPEPNLGLQTSSGPEANDLLRRGLSYDRFYSLPEEERTALQRDIARKADLANQARLAELGLADHLPGVFTVTGAGVFRQPIGDKACARVLTTTTSTGRGVSTIYSLAVASDDVESSTLQVVGSRPVLYASERSLVFAAPSQESWWFWAQPQLDEATDLQWFDVDGLQVQHRASGRVAGIVQDSFGIDVEGDQLRVATTTGTWGRWWLSEPEPMMNHLAVFDAKAGQLVPRGIVGGIAPGERIWSARFTPDRAYLVTFRQMDPLWVIDLSGAPRILGELEIPGVSTYLHPLGDDALLTIGLGPGPDGQGLDWGRIQVSLFDTSDPRNPRRADSVFISPEGGYSFSGAVDEHKAFTYWDAAGLLAVPLSTSRGFEVWNAGYPDWVQENHVALSLIQVDRGALDLTLYGEVDQDALRSEGNGWAPEIQRSYFLGFPRTGPASVYAISPLGVTSHDVESLGRQSVVRFDAA